MSIFMSIGLIFFFFLGITLHTHLFVRIKIARNSMSTSTYQLQLMLFRAISVQIFIGYCFLLIPLIIAGFLVFFRVHGTGKYVHFMLTFMSMHTFIDYLTTMYFITPYRKTITKWLGLQKRY